MRPFMMAGSFSARTIVSSILLISLLKPLCLIPSAIRAFLTTSGSVLSVYFKPFQDVFEENEFQLLALLS